MTVSFWKKEVSLDSIGLMFNATAPCPKIGNTDEESIKSDVKESTVDDGVVVV